MKEIYQLIELIEKLGQPSKSPLVNTSDDNSLEAKLYLKLKEAPLSEDDAIKSLYKDSKRDAFKMVKSRLRRKLYNHLLFIDYDQLNLLSSTELRCKKIILEASTLFITGDYNLAERHIKHAIKLSKEAKITPLIVQALEIYRKVLVGSAVSFKLFIECEEELDKYYKIQDYERKAERLFSELSILMRLGIEARLEVLNKLNFAIDTIKSYWEESDSPSLFWQYHKLKMIHFELTGDYTSQIEFIRETNKLYEKGLIHHAYFPLNFNKFAIVYAHLRCKEYAAGIKAAEEFRAEALESSHNWFANMENYFLLFIHSKRYKEAGVVLKDVFKNPFFKKINQYHQENWALFTRIYNLINNSDFKYLLNIDLSKTVKDKKGFNVWLLILDFLTNLKQGKHEHLYRESERIRKYMSKHLKSKADPRYKLFLKLLLLVVKEEFDEVSIKLKSRYLVKKLEQTPPAGDAYAEIEIVPFEHLWEFILHSVATTKVKV